MPCCTPVALLLRPPARPVCQWHSVLCPAPWLVTSAGWPPHSARSGNSTTDPSGQGCEKSSATKVGLWHNAATCPMQLALIAQHLTIPTRLSNTAPANCKHQPICTMHTNVSMYKAIYTALHACWSAPTPTYLELLDALCCSLALTLQHAGLRHQRKLCRLRVLLHLANLRIKLLPR